VQLGGFVSSRGDIDRATAIARAVQGVASLANDMRLELVTTGSA
jgi:osmotically-inducible protein OsmY